MSRRQTSYNSHSSQICKHGTECKYINITCFRIHKELHKYQIDRNYTDRSYMNNDFTRQSKNTLNIHTNQQKISEIMNLTIKSLHDLELFLKINPGTDLNFFNSFPIRYAYDTDNIRLAVVLVKYGCDTNIQVNNSSDYEKFLKHVMKLVTIENKKIADNETYDCDKKVFTFFKINFLNRKYEYIEDCFKNGSVYVNLINSSIDYKIVDFVNDIFRTNDTKMAAIFLKYGLDLNPVLDLNHTENIGPIREFFNGVSFDKLSADDASNIRTIYLERIKKYIQKGYRNSTNLALANSNIDVNFDNGWAIKTAFATYDMNIGDLLIYRYQCDIDVGIIDPKFVHYLNEITNYHNKESSISVDKIITKDYNISRNEINKCNLDIEDSVILFKIAITTNNLELLEKVLKTNIDPAMDNNWALWIAYDNAFIELAECLFRHGYKYIPTLIYDKHDNNRNRQFETFIKIIKRIINQ